MKNEGIVLCFLNFFFLFLVFSHFIPLLYVAFFLHFYISVHKSKKHVFPALQRQKISDIQVPTHYCKKIPAHLSSKYLEFSNKCLFRIHLLSHLEVGEEGLETGLLELTSLQVVSWIQIYNRGSVTLLRIRILIHIINSDSDIEQNVEFEVNFFKI